MTQDEMDSLIDGNEKRILEAEGRRGSLYNLNLSTFTVREFLYLTRSNSFTKIGQRRIADLYKRYIREEK